MRDLATQQQRNRFSAEVSGLLTTEVVGRCLEHFDSVGSTNALAVTEASRGAAEGTVISTEFQTSGRGRFGRRWQGVAGQNLMFSVILRPTIPPERYGIITVACGVAAAEAIENFVDPVDASIKWPNDILIEKRKCCGTLLESVPTEPGILRPAVVVGVGVNVNQIEFPREIEETATSLRAVRGQVVPRAFLMAKLLNSLEKRYFEAISGDVKGLIGAYENRLSGKLERVSLRMSESGAQFSGTLIGVDENGALRLEDDGRRMRFYAGEITFRK